MRRSLPLLIGISLGCVLTAIARDGEEVIAITALPTAVRDAIKAQFESAKLLKACKETEAGQTTFAVALEFKGEAIEVELKPNGEVLEIEREIAVGDLPTAATKALRARFPKARISEVVAIQRELGGPMKYEVLLTSEVTISSDGDLDEHVDEHDEDLRDGDDEQDDTSEQDDD